MEREGKTRRCSWCRTPATVRCGRCKDPYCSRECQREHWPYHKVWCRTEAEERTQRELAREREKQQDGLREVFRPMPEENEEAKPLVMMVSMVEDASGGRQARIIPTIESLPNEVLVSIFEKLDAHALVTITRVCRMWRNMALAEDILWWRHLVSPCRLRKIELGLRPPPTADELRDSFGNFMRNHCAKVIAARHLHQQARGL